MDKLTRSSPGGHPLISPQSLVILGKNHEMARVHCHRSPLALERFLNLLPPQHHTHRILLLLLLPFWNMLYQKRRMVSPLKSLENWNLAPVCRMEIILRAV